LFRSLQRGGFDFICLYVFFSYGIIFFLVQESMVCVLVDGSQEKIVFDRSVQDQPFSLSVFRHEGDTVCDGVLGRFDLHFFPFDIDISAVLWVSAEQGPHSLSASRSDQSGKAQYLAGISGEADIPQYAYRVKMFDAEEFFAAGGLLFWKQIIQ